MRQPFRRSIILAVTSSFVLPALRVLAAEPRKLPKVALVWNAIPEAEMKGEPPVSRYTREFIDALRDAGLVDGRDIVLLRRSAEGQQERIRRIMEELARSDVDLIVTTSPESVQAATKATDRIPIIGLIDGATDSGVISSLARPGGNVTGVGVDSPTIPGKSLQFLKDFAPATSRVAVFAQRHARSRAGAAWRDQLGSDARSMNLELLWVSIDASADFDRGFASIRQQRSNALYVPPLPVNYANLRRIAEGALAQRLPSIGPFREFADLGGLMSYGDTDSNRLAADYVKKILAGTKPGDLPFLQPTDFELAINSRTAKALGLAVPQSLIALRPQIIQ